MNNEQRCIDKFDRLIENEGKLRRVLEHWRVGSTEQFLEGIKKLCECGKIIVAAEAIGKHQDEVSAQAKEYVHSYVLQNTCDYKEVVQTLFILAYDEELVAYLNQPVGEEQIRKIFEIYFYYQEKSEYSTVFRLIYILSLVDDLALLTKILVNQRGIFYYKDFYSEWIKKIFLNVWKTEEFDAVLAIRNAFGLGEEIAEYLELTKEEVLGQLFTETSVAKLRIAYHILSNGRYEKSNADIEMWEYLKQLPETEDVAVMKWYHRFVAYKEGLITYDELCDFVGTMSERKAFKHNSLTAFITTRVMVQIAMDDSIKNYFEFVELLGENNVFLRGKEDIYIVPKNICQKINEERRVRNNEVLREIFLEKYADDIKGFFDFYLNSHFKYIVKLGDVLNMIFEIVGKVSNDLFKDIHFHCRAPKVLPSNKEADRNVIFCVIRDCLADNIMLEVDKDVVLKENSECQLVIDAYIPKMRSNDSVRYKALLTEDAGEISILKKKSVYDDLFEILERMAKYRHIERKDLRQLETIQCPKLEKFFIRRFYRFTAQIICDSANKVERVVEFIEVINKIGINPCDIEMHPEKVEYGDDLTRDRAVSICRSKTFSRWRALEYESREKELEVKKKLAWIFMNSYMRFYSSFDEFLQILLLSEIETKELMRTCFGNYRVIGSLAKNSEHLGNINPITLVLRGGYFLRYEEVADVQIAEALPDRTRVVFQLEDIKDRIIRVKNLSAQEYNYGRQYEAVVKLNQISSALSAFSKSRLVGHYSYTQLIQDWCAKHDVETQFLNIPLGLKNVIYKGYFAENEKRFIIKGLDRQERFDVRGLDTTLETEKVYELVLVGFDAQNKVLHFERWN